MLFSGLSACSLTVLTIAAPMSKLFYVIKYRNTECLPFPMILTSFFVSTLWLLYGIIEEDIYLMVSSPLEPFNMKIGYMVPCRFQTYFSVHTWF